MECSDAPRFTLSQRPASQANYSISYRREVHQGLCSAGPRDRLSVHALCRDHRASVCALQGPQSILSVCALQGSQNILSVCPCSLQGPQSIFVWLYDIPNCSYHQQGTNKGHQETRVPQTSSRLYFQCPKDLLLGSTCDIKCHPSKLQVTGDR